MCGEPVPASSAPVTEEAEEEIVSSEEDSSEETVEWVEDGDFVVCPLCRASYYKDEAPAVCERCAEEEAHKNTVWVMPSRQTALAFVHAGGEEILLTDGLVLGRAETACLAASPYVSRRHARIDVKGDEISISDTGSTNGTFVNGQRLAPLRAYALSAGDVVELDKERFEVRQKAG